MSCKHFQREVSVKNAIKERPKRQGGVVWKENLDHFCLLLRQKNALKTCTRDNKPRGPIRELSSEHTTKKVGGGVWKDFLNMVCLRQQQKVVYNHAMLY